LILESVADAEQRAWTSLRTRPNSPRNSVTTPRSYSWHGNPVAEIADYAEAEGFDTIFVGHQGRSERTGCCSAASRSRSSNGRPFQ